MNFVNFETALHYMQSLHIDQMNSGNDSMYVLQMYRIGFLSFPKECSPTNEKEVIEMNLKFRIEIQATNEIEKQWEGWKLNSQQKE